MTNVLRGMKDAEGESGQEVTGREEAGHRAKPEARARCGEGGGWRDERGERLVELNEDRRVGGIESRSCLPHLYSRVF